MANVQNALLQMYRIARTAKQYEKALDPYETPFTSIYGQAADAIYDLLGECTATFEESVTCLVLETVSLSEERAISIMMNEYKKNHEPAMPKPNLISPDELRKMQKQNGYQTPEGEWM